MSEVPAPDAQPPLCVHLLGTLDYHSALALQQRLIAARAEGSIVDTLLLLQHPPVITLGRGAKHAHVLASRDALATRGIEVIETGRGGDVTYHGPGQLVGYAIVDLNPDRRDVRRYVAGLEEVMLQLSAAYGLQATRIAGLNGAWIGDRKIGAVGVRIQRWITMHGFAFNVNTDLSAFDWIVPCGIRDKAVTSLQRELGTELPMEQVQARAARVFAEVFARTPRIVRGVPV